MKKPTFSVYLFKRKLRKLRHQSGRPYPELAYLCGISTALWMFFEQGKIKNPTITSLMKIADFFGMSIDELVSYKRKAKKKSKKKKP